MLKLRPFAADDIDRLIGWVPDADALMRWAGPRYSWPLTADQISRELVRAATTPETFKMFVARDAAGHAVGHIEIGDIDRTHGLAHLMRVLVAPSARGHGLGAAMVDAAVRQCFDALGLHRIELVVLDINRAAIGLYQRLGFTREGLSREARVMPDGRRVGRLHMGLLASEWRARRAA